MSVPPLTLLLATDVDQQILTDLLRQLQMRQVGRFTDDRDGVPGERRIDVEGTRHRDPLEE